MQPERTTVYRRRQPAVVSEIIDGEAIVINLDNGNYYSLTGSGAQIWAGIEAGESAAQIEARVLAAWLGDEREVSTDVADFLARLSAESLVETGAATAAPVPPLPASAARPAYVAPGFERYDDMQALLLADPIHDVNEAGWPHLGPGGRKA